MMELTFDKLKSYVPVAITVISTIVSGAFFAKDYITTNFVSRTEFNDLRSLAAQYVLENRKMLLETRIYVLNMCKVTENCAYKSTADVEIDKTKRELDDIRSHLSSLKRKDLE